MRKTILIFFIVANTALGSDLVGKNILNVEKEKSGNILVHEPAWTPDDDLFTLDILSVKPNKDGSIYVLGKTQDRGKAILVLARYLADNRLDRSFGTNGATYLAMPSPHAEAASETDGSGAVKLIN